MKVVLLVNTAAAAVVAKKSADLRSSAFICG
jgi:hypothetical protein